MTAPKHPSATETLRWWSAPNDMPVFPFTRDGRSDGIADEREGQHVRFVPSLIVERRSLFTADETFHFSSAVVTHLT